MQIRPITDADIPAVAELMRSLSDEFIVHESSPEAASSFARENDAAGLRGFIAAGTMYHVAEVDNVIAGFIAIREKKHVFHMFVHKNYHRQGIAKALWQVARKAAGDAEHTAIFTVNASNYAVPVYEAMGFVRSMPTQCKNGLYYNPMQLNGGTIA